jgi:Methyltransferase domain/Glycosyl transferase family 2
MRNIFACLVHESRECVIDLVRNLRFLDPSSQVLLYNGGVALDLLNHHFPFEQYGVVVHPSPRPLAWGRLHEFALGCMQFALDELDFDTLTIVDSDQLGTRPGYSEYLGRFLAGRPTVGFLSNLPAVLPFATAIAPAQAAFKEIDLWRPFLRRFPQGEQKFVYWSFWPSCVFTAKAARDLLRLFATDSELQDIMRRTRIWATEEVILPTLVAALGYEVAPNPCSYDYVKYRACYSLGQAHAALDREDVFWIHPVARRYDDAVRKRIRERLNHYQVSPNGGMTMPASRFKDSSRLVLTLPILAKMKKIQGWLEEDEADLLIAAAARALATLPGGSAVVEVGSFCGRSTVVLGSVVKSLGAETKVYAIDPHDGKVGALDQGIQSLAPSGDRFRHNIAEAALTTVVETIEKRSFEVTWDKPIGFLLIDGFHDYPNVARDFHHFEPQLVPGAYIAFHDYADYYPGVKTFVNELLGSGHYHQVGCASSMMVVRKEFESESSASEDSQPVQVHAMDSALSSEAEPFALNANARQPLVSCIMPTANRPRFVPQAIKYFLQQDYPNRELILLDDGADSVADLIPTDPRIRYVRLAQRYTMGAKHNLACEMAQGKIIAHWDDDDWMADWRLSYQVQELLEQPPMTLCGLARVLFYEPRTDRAWEYTYQLGPPWVCGASFCYRREFWEQHRFPSMNEGADTAFVWGLKNANVCAHSNHTFYVGMVHPRNTSRKTISDFQWRSYPTQNIRELMQTDFSFYADTPVCR